MCESATSFVTIVWPLRMIVRRSQSSKTSSSRCETYTIATPRSRRERRTANRSVISVSVSEAVGSSRMSTLASMASARAKATIVCCTGDRSPASIPRGIFWLMPSSSARARRRRAFHCTMPAAAGRLLAEEDVLGDADRRDDRQLLVERDDPGAVGDAHIGELDLFAVAQHRAGIGGVQAGQDLDERRLAGAVLAEQRVDLSRPHREARVLERVHAVEPLGDVARLERGHRVGQGRLG